MAVSFGNRFRYRGPKYLAKFSHIICHRQVSPGVFFANRNSTTKQYCSNHTRFTSRNVMILQKYYVEYFRDV